MRQKLYSAVIADILDELGYRDQCMDHGINPLREDDVVWRREGHLDFLAESESR